METSQQISERVISTDSSASMNILTLNAEENPTEAGNFMEKTISTKDEKIVSPNATHDVTAMGVSRDVTLQAGSFDAGCDCNAVYPSNVYAPQAHAYYYGGYDNTGGDWDDYSHYVRTEGVEVGSPGIYNENPSLVFHSGYGFSPQMPYGPYSPVTTPLPSVRGDGSVYSQFPASYYHQPVSPSLPYPPSPMSQAELSMTTSFDQQGAYIGDSSNSNGVAFGPRPGYTIPYGSFGGGSFAGESGNPPVYDLRQGFDGFGSGGPWSDWSKTSHGQRSMTTLSSLVASPQSIVTIGSFGHTQIADGMASSQQRPPYISGPVTNSYSRGYMHGGMYLHGTTFGGSVSGLGPTSQGWVTVDKGRRRGRGSASCNCNGTLDVLVEQNRGPRSSKPKNPSLDHNSTASGKSGLSSHKHGSELYDRSDFATDLKDAKFFIIKSYSEDNVHKSIKYNVWASTPSGNRKLDAAYREAKEKENACSVFLLFSVNASAQFCGIAEMTGVVDFDKSVDYWQQDKWSGQFPVKWHIIKDVPNSLFRHIILENNDNKPVTNSRDTQEVGFEQGLEILNIFKNYDSNVSILDDFDYYEERQKLMQEKKARQQMNSMPIPMGTAIDFQGQVPISGDLIKRMSKSFAQVVKIENNTDPVVENGGSAMVSPVEGPVMATMAVATSQGSLGAVGDA